MEEEESRVRPVGHPQKKTVSATIQDNKGDVGKGDGTSSVTNVPHELISTVGEDGVGSVAGEASKASGEVDTDEIRDEDHLPAGGDEAEAQDWHAVLSSPGRGVDKVCVEAASKLRWEGE